MGTKKQMKFFALASAALIATSSAIRLDQAPASAQLVTVMATMPSLKLDEVFKALDGNGDGSLTLPKSTPPLPSTPRRTVSSSPRAGRHKLQVCSRVLMKTLTVKSLWVRSKLLSSMLLTQTTTVNGAFRRHNKASKP